MVFYRKNNEQYKVRFVAKENAHKEGFNYNEVFSPIVKVKAQLKREFNMKNFEEAKKISGMRLLEIAAHADYGCSRRTMFQRCWNSSTWQKQDWSLLL